MLYSVIWLLLSGAIGISLGSDQSSEEDIHCDWTSDLSKTESYATDSAIVNQSSMEHLLERLQCKEEQNCQLQTHLHALQERIQQLKRAEEETTQREEKMERHRKRFIKYLRRRIDWILEVGMDRSNDLQDISEQLDHSQDKLARVKEILELKRKEKQMRVEISQQHRHGSELRSKVEKLNQKSEKMQSRRNRVHCELAGLKENLAAKNAELRAIKSQMLWTESSLNDRKMEYKREIKRVSEEYDRRKREKMAQLAAKDCRIQLLRARLNAY